MIMSRSADVRSPLLVAAVMCDCRTFMWKVTEEAAAGAQQAEQARQREGGGAAAAVGSAAQGGQEGGRGQGQGQAQQSQGLVPMFATPDQVQYAVACASWSWRRYTCIVVLDKCFKSLCLSPLLPSTPV